MWVWPAESVGNTVKYSSPIYGDCIEMTSQDDLWSSNAPNTIRLIN